MSDLHAYERSEENHLRPYLGVRADLVAWRDAGYRSLAFHTYLRWTSDFSNKLATDPQIFVYNAYLKLTGLPRRVNFYLGRQFVYSGVGSTLLDGLRIRYDPFRILHLDIFGGSSVSSHDPEQIRTFSDFGSLGGRLSFMPRSSTKLGLNWMLRKADGQVSYHRLGLDGKHIMGCCHLYGRVVYNVVGLRLADILTRVSYIQGPWYLCGEFNWREPSVPSNSLFSLIEFHPYKEVRLDLQRLIWRNLSVVTQLQVGFLTGEDSWRTSVGVRTSYYSIYWHHQSGYGGDNNGVSASLNLRLNQRWECYAIANLYRYRVQREQENRSDAYSASLGLLRRFGWGFTARAEGQYLRNAVQSDDIRILLRFIKDFSLNHNLGNTGS